MITLAEQWAAFEAACVPANAGYFQRRQMKAAFYGGASIVMETLKRIGEPDIPEQDGVDWLTAYNVELAAFVADYAGGSDVSHH